MARKNYDEVSVCRKLKQINAITVDESNKRLIVKVPDPKVGNGTFGKIDFLVHHRGWFVIYQNNNGGYSTDRANKVTTDTGSDDMQTKSKKGIDLSKKTKPSHKAPNKPIKRLK